MSSPITLSNFNNIDFSVILNAVMQQASQPLTTLQNKQADIATTNNQYNLLATKLGSLETAAAGLSTASVVTQYTPTLSDSGYIGVIATGNAVPGTYDVTVNRLAKAQVSASSSSAVDTDTTVVATGGTLTIGGVAVTVTGPLTLAGLASQINATANVPVSASVVQSSPNAYRLVLTSTQTGLANAFSVTNGLTGSVAFDNPNAQEADDAAVTINGLQISSSSNTLTSAIPGTTLSLVHPDATKTTTVTVKADDSALTDSVKSFVTAYNGLISFITDQSTAAASGQTGTLAHEALLRQARSALRTALGDAYGSGTFSHLAEVGIGFNQTGQLTLAPAALAAALSKDRAGVVALFTGTSTGINGFTNGAFGTVQAALDEFTRSGGFVSAAQIQLTAQSSRLDSQIADMQSRLAVQRKALQAQYTAADQAMTQLKSQSGTLSNMAATQSNK